MDILQLEPVKARLYINVEQIRGSVLERNSYLGSETNLWKCMLSWDEAGDENWDFECS
jgi:hypothetical protein